MREIIDRYDKIKPLLGKTVVFGKDFVDFVDDGF
jgi:hypothetical protein